MLNPAAEGSAATCQACKVGTYQDQDEQEQEEATCTDNNNDQDATNLKQAPKPAVKTTSISDSSSTESESSDTHENLYYCAAALPRWPILSSWKLASCGTTAARSTVFRLRERRARRGRRSW